jgi:endonuclease YncB( thermonuclease family)
MVLALAIPLAGLVAAECPDGRQETTIMRANIAPSVDGAPLHVSWPDGDSGIIEGRLFRLYRVDAPEDSPSRAQCAAERLRAGEALSAVRPLTDGGAVEIRKSRGIDKYNRDLISLSADGRDVASSLVASGHAKRWNSEAGEIKPRWCPT